jgi:hypothetical protein
MQGASKGGKMIQSALLQQVISLPKGMAINISKEVIWQAAREEFTGLDYMCGVTRKDVSDFIKKIEKNWDIHITENMEQRTYTIIKESL